MHTFIIEPHAFYGTLNCDYIVAWLTCSLFFVSSFLDFWEFLFSFVFICRHYCSLEASSCSRGCGWSTTCSSWNCLSTQSWSQTWTRGWRNVSRHLLLNSSRVRNKRKTSSCSHCRCYVVSDWLSCDDRPISCVVHRVPDLQACHGHPGRAYFSCDSTRILKKNGNEQNRTEHNSF